LDCIRDFLLADGVTVRSPADEALTLIMTGTGSYFTLLLICETGLLKGYLFTGEPEAPPQNDKEKQQPESFF